MLLLELSVYHLDRSTQNQFGDDRESRAAKTGVANVEFSTAQNEGKTELDVKAVVKGSSGMTYKPMIIFKNVKLQDADSPQNVTVVDYNGKELHIDPESVKSSNVMVRCDCMDFYWRFANWNLKHKALLGDKPGAYVKKTNRPPVNPMQKPGVCKHLYKLVQQLRGKGLL